MQEQYEQEEQPELQEQLEHLRLQEQLEHLRLRLREQQERQQQAEQQELQEQQQRQLRQQERQQQQEQQQGRRRRWWTPRRSDDDNDGDATTDGDVLHVTLPSYDEAIGMFFQHGVDQRDLDIIINIIRSHFGPSLFGSCLRYLLLKASGSALAV